jgi:MFS family permease
LYVKSLFRMIAIVLAGVACGVLLGAGVPLAWVWVASQVQPTGGQAVSGTAVAIVIVGPLITYAATLLLLRRVGAPRGRGGRPVRMAWNTSRDEEHRIKRETPALEQIFVIATMLVAVGFIVWFIGFAHQTPWGSG